MNGNGTSTSTKPENGNGLDIFCVFWLFAPMHGVPFNSLSTLICDAMCVCVCVCVCVLEVMRKMLSEVLYN